MLTYSDSKKALIEKYKAGVKLTDISKQMTKNGYPDAYGRVNWTCQIISKIANEAGLRRMGKRPKKHTRGRGPAKQKKVISSVDIVDTIEDIVTSSLSKSTKEIILRQLISGM